MHGVVRGRLLPATAAPSTGERVEILLSDNGTVVEQILSGSLVEPIDFRRDHVEWVVVLSGHAVLEVSGERIELADGDWVVIPSGAAHRVVSTRAGTRWLAVHLRSGDV